MPTVSAAAIAQSEYVNQFGDRGAFDLEVFGLASRRAATEGLFGLLSYQVVDIGQAVIPEALARLEP